MKTHVLIPVKRLSESKKRLSGVLGLDERRDLVIFMLSDILNTISSYTAYQTALIGVDDDIKRLAEKFDVYFLPDPGGGLNQSLRYAIRRCLRIGAERVLILPADIPLLTESDLEGISRLSEDHSVIVSPSKDGGTNALMLNPPDVMEPLFGSRSFERHVREASRRRVPLRIYRSPTILMDIDSVEDLKVLLRVGGDKLSRNFLMRIGFDKRLSGDGSQAFRISSRTTLAS